MIDFLKKIYHKYSDTKFVKLFGKIYRNGFFISNYMAYLRMKKLSKKRHNLSGTVKVLFLCQYPQAWNKMKSVFEMMIDDERFDVKILAVPNNINKPDNKIYLYFSGLYGEKYVINSYDNGMWYNLKELMPDYVFYQRPYDQYLPKEYRSGKVSKYSKICHLVYGYLLVDEDKDVCVSKIFFRNVYMFFAENSVSQEFNIKRFKISHNKGYRKTLNIGYPVLEYFIKHRLSEKNDNEGFRVLWTPRWSEDKEVGGSNFINYKDEIIKLIDIKSDVNVVFRPHPMLFEHFISVGRITQEEANNYLECYRKKDRLEYNDTEEYVDVFWNTDVLVTDISSVIVEYFITGKPIVYCDTGAVPDIFFDEMLKVIYVTKTWEQTMDRIIELSRGIDPLREERERKIRQLFGEDFEHISERFLDVIYNDYSA